MDINAFISGFVEGEGCFCVSFSERSKMNTGIEVRPSFSISQHKRSLSLLQQVHGIFGCGGIRFVRTDNTYKYEVRSIQDLQRVVIPFFDTYPLQGAKAHDFQLFKQVCEMVSQNLHRNPVMLKELIAIAYQINCSGKRKYTEDELLRHMTR